MHSCIKLSRRLIGLEIAQLYLYTFTKIMIEQWWAGDKQCVKCM